MSAPLATDEETDCRQEAGFRSLLLEHRRSVFLLCLGFAHNQTEAQDLLQETLAKALAHRQRVPPENPLAWLLRIARNTCLDQERRKKVRRVLLPWLAGEEPCDATPHHRLEQEEEIALVRRAIRALPRAQRDVLVLREYGDLSYREIAQVLRLSEGTVMSRLSRARRAVLDFCQENFHGTTAR
ncbi:MAG TPA: RNA polymerase sigma factor [Candidatus Aminicenantes bacterium]|nr:RNA polymerase sigma factor [Candidatus Aminicenantes bacterium]